MHPQLLELIRASVPEGRRSVWMRDAFREKLERDGVDLSGLPPDALTNGEVEEEE